MFVHVGARAGHGHRALRARQIANKPADIGQRPAVLDGKRARARAADQEVSGIGPAGEPAPDTTTVPCEPDGLPTSPVVVFSSPSPPPPMVTIPLPPAFKPRIRLFADAGPVTCAVPPLLTTASSAGVGTPAGAQLVPVIQLPVVSIQVLTCACAGTEAAATTPIVASNLEKTNLPLRRAGDVAR